MDPLVFMLALGFMTTTEYDLWELGIFFVDQVMYELEYNKFSRTRLMPSLIAAVCSCFSHFSLLSHHLHSCTLLTFK